jgi:hypothetical protein
MHKMQRFAAEVTVHIAQQYISSQHEVPMVLPTAHIAQQSTSSQKEGMCPYSRRRLVPTVHITSSQQEVLYYSTRTSVTTSHQEILYTLHTSGILAVRGTVLIAQQYISPSISTVNITHSKTLAPIRVRKEHRSFPPRPSTVQALFAQITGHLLSC